MKKNNKLNLKRLTRKEVEGGRSSAYDYIFKEDKTIMKIFGYKVAKVKSEDGFTMFLEDMSGGPIIFDKNEKRAIETFKEALGLAVSIKKLTNFRATGKFGK